MNNYRAIRGDPPSNSLDAVIIVFLPMAIILSIVVVQKWQKLGLIYIFIVRILVLLTIITAVYDCMYEVVRNFELLSINTDTSGGFYFLYAWYIWVCILIATFLSFMELASNTSL